MSEPLVLATANPDKVVEMAELLGDRFEIQGRPADLAETVEDGETLEANAAKKAFEVVTATGCLAVADDTGLFVAALDGRPGVRSARYASQDSAHADSPYEANVDKLLAELAGCSGPSERTAEFRTVIAARWPDGRELSVAGTVGGWITPERRGTAGFGYDPVFAPHEGDGRTFAEMSAAEKHALSHRARAIRALLTEI